MPRDRRKQDIKGAAGTVTRSPWRHGDSGVHRGRRRDKQFHLTVAEMGGNNGQRPPHPRGSTGPLHCCSGLGETLALGKWGDP